MKTVALAYLAAFTAYACADKGVPFGIGMFVFVGVPMLLGYLINGKKDFEDVR